ncbi:MAG: cytochrome-c peroxidase [Chitinophagaceae bacterium]
MHHRKTIFALACIMSVGMIYSLYSCKKSDSDTTGTADNSLAALNLPATAFNYANQTLPFYLNAPPIAGQINTPPNNQITDAGATLGRVLFYDKTLSINNSIACASCHKQEFAFSDNIAFSKGFAGGSTARNSMSLINARYYPSGRFFWDERAATLEAQTLIPVQDLTEMGMTLNEMVTRLKIKTHYPVLFEKHSVIKILPVTAWREHWPNLYVQ